MLEIAFVGMFWFLSGLSFLLLATGLVGVWRHVQLSLRGQDD